MFFLFILKTHHLFTIGVPLFFGVFLRNIGWFGIRQKSFPTNIAALGIDLNSLIHEAAQIVYVYGKGKSKNPDIYARQIEQLDNKTDQQLQNDFFDLVTNLIATTITAVQPQKYVYLAVDGVPPKAKMDNQRGRRYFAMHTANLKQQQNAALPKNKREPEPRFDPTAITPGTPMMFELDKHIKEWLKVYTASGNIPIIIYSPMQEPGEGEHKIFDFIRNNFLEPSDIMVINGLDADLVMLSLLAPLDNILISRTEFMLNDKYFTDQQGKIFYNKQSDIFNINNMRTAIKNDFGTDSAVDDFVIMSFLIGLDFLPRQPSLESVYPQVDYRNKPKNKTEVQPIGLNGVIAIYKQLKPNLTKDGQINWPGLLQLLYGMAQFEPELLRYETSRPIKFPSKVGQKALLNIETKTAGFEVVRKLQFSYPIYQQEWYKRALSARGPVVNFPDQNLNDLTQNLGDINQSQPFSPASLNNLTPSLSAINQSEQPFSQSNLTSAENIDRMCIKYLQGVGWCYNYYQANFAQIDIDWYYGYYYTPLFTDLYRVLQQKQTIGGYRRVKDQTPFNMLEQLLAVIPPTLQHFIPEQVRYLVSPSQILSQYTPYSFDITNDGKDTDYEVVVWIPFFNPHLLHQAYQQVKLTPALIDMYQTQGAVVYQREDAWEQIESFKAEQRAQVSANYQEGQMQLREQRRGKLTVGLPSTDPRFRAPSASSKIKTSSRAFVNREVLAKIQHVLNPMLQFSELQYADKQMVVVRDDVLNGGTKQRGLGRYMLSSTAANGNSIQQFVYSGPSNSYDQITVGYVTGVVERKSTVIVPKQVPQNKITTIAGNYGAKIIERNKPSKSSGVSITADLRNFATDYVDNAKIPTELLPVNLDNNQIVDDLAFAIQHAIPKDMTAPARLWLVANTGLLVKALYKVWPSTQYMIVQIGYPLSTDILRDINHITFNAKEKVYECVSKDELPPYPSLACYDSKAWQFITQYGKTGDYIWNTAQDV